MNFIAVSRSCKIYIFLIIIMTVLAGVNVASASLCPDKCRCNPLSRILSCSRQGFVAIPENIPSDTLQLNLNGNVFEKPTLQATNFSGMASLDHLYMSECGIEIIEPGTFSHLFHLKWLDLSSNRIHSVAPRTFHGLNLLHLFINGNRNIRLVADSFNGLQTTGLYLHDCLLTSLEAEVLQPLNGSLTHFWLNGNKLTTIDSRLETLFWRLNHTRLHSNPFHCNCKLSWLKTYLDANSRKLGGSTPITCFTPAALRGRFILDLVPSELGCSAPMFAIDDASFGISNNNSNGTSLKCIASGDPTPTLYWIKPSGKTTKYPSTTESDRNEAVLYLGINNAFEVKDDRILSRNESIARVGVDQKMLLSSERDEIDVKSNEIGVYVCIAINDIDNVSLTMNIMGSVSSASGRFGAITPTAFAFYISFVILNTF